MSSKYVQPGHVIDYVNDTGAAIPNGAVVRFGNTLGVAQAAIGIGASGRVALDGVYSLPKVSGAVIKAGESLTWDASANAFDDNQAAPATGDITGAAALAFEDAGAGATALLVKLTGAPGVRAA